MSDPGLQNALFEIEYALHELSTDLYENHDLLTPTTRKLLRRFIRDLEADRKVLLDECEED